MDQCDGSSVPSCAASNDVLDGAWLSDASESAGDTEEPLGEGGVRSWTRGGRAHPLPKNEGGKEQKTKRREQAQYREGAGELGSTPRVSLEAG